MTLLQETKKKISHKVCKSYQKHGQNVKRVHLTDISCNCPVCKKNKNKKQLSQSGPDVFS